MRLSALLGIMTLGGVIHVLGTVRARRPQWPPKRPVTERVESGLFLSQAARFQP